jgi:hypothetical protein
VICVWCKVRNKGIGHHKKKISDSRFLLQNGSDRNGQAIGCPQGNAPVFIRVKGGGAAMVLQKSKLSNCMYIKPTALQCFFPENLTPCWDSNLDHLYPKIIGPTLLGLRVYLRKNWYWPTFNSQYPISLGIKLHLGLLIIAYDRSTLRRSWVRISSGCM